MLSGLTGASEEHGAGLRITGQPPSPLLEELAAAAGAAAAVDTNTEAEPLCMTGHPLIWLEASAGGGVLPTVALQVLSARMTPPANHDIVTSVSTDLLFEIATKSATCYHVFVIHCCKSATVGCVWKGGLVACRRLSSRGVAYLV